MSSVDEDWEMVAGSDAMLLTADAAEAPPPPPPHKLPPFTKIMSLGKRAVAAGSVGTSLFGGARALFSKAKSPAETSSTRPCETNPRFSATSTDPCGQSIGATRRHTAMLRNIRGDRCATAGRERQRLMVRCEKLQELYRSTSALVLAVQKRSLEQTAVPWQQAPTVPGICDHCGGSLKLRGYDNCRLCGAVCCTECLLGVPTDRFGFPALASKRGLDAALGPGGRGLSLVDSVPICVGSCITIALPNRPADAPAACSRLTELNGDLAALRAALLDGAWTRTRGDGLSQCQRTDSGGATTEVKETKEAILALVAKAGRLRFHSEGNQRVQAKIQMAGTQLLQQSY